MKAIALNNRKLSLVVTFLFSIFLGFSQTTLNAGDIAITGVNSDNPDEFTFVLLTFVQNGTVINFTDKGWDDAGYLLPGDAEGVVTWTANSYLPCGTEITISDTGSGVYSASNGSAALTDGGFALNNNGDQIIAFQGSISQPTFLYAIHFANGIGWDGANPVSPNSSGVPSGLTDTVNAIYIGNSDNGNYGCSVTSETALILNAVSTVSNWNGTNSRIPTLGGCPFTCFTCTSPTVTWNGAWVPNAPDIFTPVIISSDYNINASFSACSLTIDPDTTLFVDNGMYVEIENDITINGNGNMVVREKGSVIQNSDVGSMIGSASVNKQTAPMSNYYEYTYWSSPVLGETIAGGLTDSDPTKRFRFEAANFKDSTRETNNDGTSDPGQDDIDDDGDDWQTVSAATVMVPGVGYASHHNESIFFLPPPATSVQFIYTFDGLFNNGVIHVPVTRNETAPVELNDINWNLIGNPYPSAIDVDLFFLENNYDAVTNPDGTLTGAVYLWSQNSLPDNANNGNENINFTSIDYAIINRVGETPADEEEGGDSELPNRFIPSGQGFFIAYPDPGERPSETGNVIFNNSMRVTGNNDQFFRLTGDDENKLALKMTTEDGIFNQMLVGYVEGATNLNDGMYYDAPRNLAAGAAAIIYSIIEDSSRKFAIQGRDPSSLNLSEVIPIGVKNTIEGEKEFTLAIAQLEGDFMTNHNIYLKDNLLNVNHNLSDSAYTFTSEAGEFNSRFEIVFASTLAANEIDLDYDDLIISNERDNYLEISTSKKSQIGKIKIFDLLGRELFDVEVNDKTKVSMNTSSLSNSVFIINVTLADGKIITKKFLNQ
ncbi:MAG: T9SS type A sorting domain-containing protein [Flavobacteriaceae bacterium]|nr:T9SS type A sorting domain-containing protein [Flavobacteriaceae bacterium]